MVTIIILVAVILGLLFIADRLRPDAVTRFEEGVLAILLAAITLISFSQVVMRYSFSTGWSGALETTRILFAWLILFGMSYGIKTGAHLGVDAFVRLLPRPAFRTAAVFGALAAAVYAITLLYSNWLQVFGGSPRGGGALDYWGKMFQLGIGLDDVRYPEWMQETFGVQERVQRWIAYLILPIGLGLLAYRSIEAVIQIVTGKRELVIASHEAEDLVAENKNILKE